MHLWEIWARTGSIAELSGEFEEPELPSWDLLDASPLWQLHREVKYFAEFFVQEKLPMIENGFLASVTTSPQKAYTLEDISTTERLRLHRAIYRYSIFSDMFSDEFGFPKTWYYDGEDLAALLLALFPAWQVEELSCIHDFITDRLATQWRNMENYIFNILKSDPSWRQRYDEFRYCAFSVSYHQAHDIPTLPLTVLLHNLTPALDDVLIEKIGGRRTSGKDFMAAGLGAEHSDVITESRAWVEHCQMIGTGRRCSPPQKDLVDKLNSAWLWAHECKPCKLYVDSTHD